MLCMIAKLDETAVRRLRELQAAIPGAADRRPLYGHITLAAYTGEDEASFLRFGRELAAAFPAFSVPYEKLEVLAETSILVASPGRCPPLEELHRRAAERFGGELDKWTRAEAWRPHTTLYHGPGEDLQALCRRLSACFSPFPARVCSLAFSRVLDVGYEIVCSVALLPEPSGRI